MVTEEVGKELEAQERDFDELSEDIEDGLQEEGAADPAFLELMGFIGALSEEEQVALVALSWIGRGTYSADEVDDALDEARDAANDRTGEYLLGMPMLPDYLEEGMNILGIEDGLTEDD